MRMRMGMGMRMRMGMRMGMGMRMRMGMKKILETSHEISRIEINNDLPLTYK